MRDGYCLATIQNLVLMSSYRDRIPGVASLAIIAAFALLSAMLLPPVPAARRWRPGSGSRPQQIVRVVAPADDSERDDVKLLPSIGSNGAASGLVLSAGPSASGSFRFHNSAPVPQSGPRSPVRRE